MDPARARILGSEHTSLASIDSFLLALALLPILVMIVYNRYYHSLSSFPGPFMASVWPGWRDWGNYRDLEDQEPLLHERYGPIIRVSPNMISVADPDYLKEICTQANSSRGWLSFAHKGVVDASSIGSSALHEELRKGTMPGYAMSGAGSWEGIVDWRIRGWIGKLKAEYGSGLARFGFSEWARYLSADSVGLVVFGVDMGYSQNGKDNGSHIPGSKSGLGVAEVLVGLPKIYRALVSDSFIRNILAKADRAWLGAMQMKAGLIIDAAWESREKAEARGEEWHLKSKGTTQGVTLLEAAMSATISDGTRLTKEKVYSECFLPFIAGQDSIAFAITNTLKLLLASPGVLATLLSELATYYAQKPLSHIPPWTDIVCLDVKLPYLSAVLRESLRLHPAFPMSSPGIAPPSGIMLTHRGRLYAIPGGCKISANPRVIGRNKRIFGEDAHCFRPERWLERSEAETGEMKGIGFEWGAGSGGCLGKALAQMVVAKAIVMILRNFEVGLADGHERGEVWRLVAMGAHQSAELWVKVKPREDEMDGQGNRLGE